MRGFAKGVAMFVVLMGSLITLYAGGFFILFGGGWKFPIGIAMFIAGFRGVILGYDLMWGRPPVFSKRPWNRPWETEQPPRPEPGQWR